MNMKTEKTSCGFFTRHSWQKWKEVERLANAAGKYLLLQERQCETCGLLQLKKTVL